tara:strand:- start:287 stop:703 length:417 start_codon:yes stop_codon:yes gene_type:complete
MFFNNKNNNDKEHEDLTKIAALLIHAARIDENYSEIEKKIIKRTLIEIGANTENVENILVEAKKIEESSNQILDFTKEVKNMSEQNKIKIIETLWKIIYSNNEADIYETSLMRRLTGLLYIDNKVMGDIKEKIKREIL